MSFHVDKVLQNVKKNEIKTYYMGALSTYWPWTAFTMKSFFNSSCLMLFHIFSMPPIWSVVISPTEMTSEEAIQPRSRRPRHLFTRGDSTAMERFSAAFASAAASVSNTFSHSRSTPTKTATEHQEDSGSGSPTIPTTSTATTTITSPTTTTSTTLMSDEVRNY